MVSPRVCSWLVRGGHVAPMGGGVTLSCSQNASPCAAVQFAAGVARLRVRFILSARGHGRARDIARGRECGCLSPSSKFEMGRGHALASLELWECDHGESTRV